MSELAPRSARVINELLGCSIVVTTRHGRDDDSSYGFNLALHVKDDPEIVMHHRRQLQTILPSEPVWLEQVHGVDVLDVDELCQEGVTIATEQPIQALCYDAAVTSEKNRTLVIMTADCLPVVLVDASKGILGVAHAGWRGLAYGVLKNTVALMQHKGAIAIQAFLGPCIGARAFEVGDDVKQAFIELDSAYNRFFTPQLNVTNKYYADLQGLAEAILLALNVTVVFQDAICTVESQQDYFSYRAQKETGRFATLAWLHE